MNPLLREAELPRFDQIDASHVVPAISAILEENQAEIDRHKMASTPEQAYRAFHEFESARGSARRGLVPGVAP